MRERCPKCGSAFDGYTSDKNGYDTYLCGSEHAFAPFHGLIQSKACRIVELEGTLNEIRGLCDAIASGPKLRQVLMVSTIRAVLDKSA